MSDGTFEVTVKTLTGEAVKYSGEVGSCLEEAVSRYGEEVVFTNFVIGAKTAARNKVYSATHAVAPKEYAAKLEKGEEVKVPTQADIDVMMADWVPTVVGTRETSPDTEEKLLAKLMRMPEEKQLEFIRKLQASKG